MEQELAEKLQLIENVIAKIKDKLSKSFKNMREKIKIISSIQGIQHPSKVSEKKYRGGDEQIINFPELKALHTQHN